MRRVLSSRKCNPEARQVKTGDITYAMGHYDSRRRARDGIEPSADSNAVDRLAFRFFVSRYSHSDDKKSEARTANGTTLSQTVPKEKDP